MGQGETSFEDRGCRGGIVSSESQLYFPEDYSMKIMRAITVIFLLGALTISCGSTGGSARESAPAAEWIDGVWSGTGYQMDISSTWTIKLTVNRSENLFRIEYPSLACGGEWRVIAFTSHSGRFVEKIVFGRDKCADNGTIVITRVDANHISFTHFYENRVMSAYATLTRIR